MGNSSGDEPIGLPWRSRPFVTVLAATVVVPLGVPLLSPTLPLLRDTFAVSDVRAGYLLSAYFLPGIVLSPLIGRMLDRWGRRPVLLASLFAFGFVGVAMPFLGDFTAILVARVGQGVAAAGIFITTVTIIADSFAGTQRNAVFGFNVAILSIGRTLYPLVGGSLALFGWRVPFACYLLAVGAGLFVANVFEESALVTDPTERATIRRAIAELTVGRTIQLYGATVLAETIVFGSIMTTVPFLLAAEFDATTATIGAIVAIATLASALVAAENGRFVRHASNRALVSAGFCCFGVSLIGVGFTSSVPFVGAFALAFGGGIGLILPSVDASISRAVSPACNASALSLRNSATGLGRAAGPLSFTLVATHTGYRPLLAGVGMLSLAIGLGALLIRRSRAAPRPNPDRGA
ncbi:MFS transporter [Halovivax limisalsi]|uniref:MFS transporter n=1 Tax=Halovivax limisalsi TaxID=1453760 RepID=UPI001FFCB199|nr:MFS transporter [Halovivax limisalsi]